MGRLALQNLPSVSSGLVVDLSQKFRQGDVGDALRQVPVLQHVFHGQILDDDDLVLIHQPSRKLVEKFVPPVFGAFLLSGHFPLPESQLLLFLAEEVRGEELLPRGESDQRRQPQVDPDFCFDVGLRCDFVLEMQGHEISEKTPGPKARRQTPPLRAELDDVFL